MLVLLTRDGLPRTYLWSRDQQSATAKRATRRAVKFTLSTIGELGECLVACCCSARLPVVDVCLAGRALFLARHVYLSIVYPLTRRPLPVASIIPSVTNLEHHLGLQIKHSVPAAAPNNTFASPFRPRGWQRAPFGPRREPLPPMGSAALASMLGVVRGADRL